MAVKLPAADVEQIHAILEGVYDAQLAAHSAARTLRNILVVATVALAAGAFVSTAAAAWTQPSLLTLTGTATAASSAADRVRLDISPLVTLELWGMVGGLIGAIPAIRSIRGSSGPVGLQLAQLAVKLPTGAWTGLVGVILLQSGLIPSVQPAAAGSLAAYAILFGAGQQALTRFVDRRAGDVLDKTKTPGEKAVLPA